MFRNGDTFGKYKIERTLGTGGMGAVYLVRHSVLDSLFALKILDDAIAKKGEDFVTRFIREAKLSSNIRHPNLAAVHDAGRDEATGLYYLVMEYLPGGTLRDRIHERGRIAVPEAVYIARQVAAALVTAHERGMVHRDIKPENIMFAADGSVRLSDLGIAKGTGEQDTLVTMAAAVFGTPAYMAPEQARDASTVDGRADIWSLGVVLYEMLSGVRPYEGSGLGAIVAQLLSDEPFPDIRAVAPEVPASLAELICDMCSKDISLRVATARDLVRRLASVSSVRPEASCGAAFSESANTMATMATAATMTAEPAFGEPSVFVEPELPTDVRDFEARREGKIRRAALWRRLVIAALVPLCVLLGVFAFRSTKPKIPNPPESTNGSETGIVATNGSETGIESTQKVRLNPDESTNDCETGIVATNGSGTGMAATNDPTTVVMNKPPPPPPPPSSKSVVLVGIESEEAILRATSRDVPGVSRFICLKGSPETVGAQIQRIIAESPFQVFLSLTGYAKKRDMTNSRFELFAREIAGNIQKADMPVVLVAGDGVYGNIVRAVAQSLSIDVQ